MSARSPAKNGRSRSASRANGKGGNGVTTSLDFHCCGPGVTAEYVADKLAAYAEDRLGNDELLAVAKHVEECVPCCSEVASMIEEPAQATRQTRLGRSSFTS